MEAAARQDPASAVWAVALAREAADRGDWKETERCGGTRPWRSSRTTGRAGGPGQGPGHARRARRRAPDLTSCPPPSWTSGPSSTPTCSLRVEASDWTAADAAAARDSAGRCRGRMSRRLSRSSTPSGSAAPERRPPLSAPGGRAARENRFRPPTRPASFQPAQCRRAQQGSPPESRRWSRRAGPSRRARLSDALKADPNNRELRLALLEAACLCRSYRDGAVQVPLVAPFNDAEAPSMFYAAVVLFETGKPDEARGYLKRAMPGCRASRRRVLQ